MKLVLYENWDDTRPLAAEWNTALSASASDTVFLTWEWCNAWWQTYGAGRRLFVIAAWEGRELAGVAPFYISRSHQWGVSCNALRVIGDGSHDADYLDCFVRAGREREVIDALVRFLAYRRADWDLIEITGVAESSPCLAALAACAAERSWRLGREPIPCAVLSLPATWDEYLQMLQPRIRTKVRSSLSHIQQYLESVPAECHTPQELDVWLPSLFDLHSRRWQQERQPGVFRGQAKRDFYHHLSRSALQRGWLAFHRLSWGERPLAFQYGLRYRNRFYLLQEGYEPGFEALRPGFALRSWLIRSWIEQGLEAYDFLAGAAQHKLSWGAQVKTSVRLLVAPNRRGQWVGLEAPRAAQQLKNSAAEILPPPLLAWRREIRQRRLAASLNGHGQNGAAGDTMVRRLAARLYCRTALGQAGRHLATHYRWNGRFARRQGSTLQIFIFHRVNDDRDPFLYATPVSQFQGQVEYLARNFPVVTLDDIVAGRLAGPPQHYVAITFDDGYRDNFLHAFPILQRLGVPATIFLSTGYIDSGELPWYDRVCLAFKLTAQPCCTLAPLGELSLATEDERLRAMQRTLAMLRESAETERQQLLRELFQQLRVPPHANLPNVMLSWQEVRRMSRGGITFGAHTVNHPVLATLPVARLEEEIQGSKKTIEDRLQLPVRHFAYPFGKPLDVGREAKRVVQAAGFETAVTTVYGVNHPAQDRFELKRFCLVEPDLEMFRLKVDWNRMADSAASGQDYRQGYGI